MPLISELQMKFSFSKDVYNMKIPQLFWSKFKRKTADVKFKKYLLLHND